MKSNLVLMILVCLLSITSCDFQGAKQRMQEENLEYISSFQKSSANEVDTPKSWNGRSDYIYRHVSAVHDSTGLNQLDAPIGDLRIRIHSDFDGKKHNAETISIKWVNQAWEGYYYDGYYNGDVADSAHWVMQHKSFMPRQGWDRFMNQLFQQQILTLPTMNKTAGRYVGVADGEWIFFEINATSGKRFYYYYSPDILTELDLAEARNVVNIAAIVKRNLPF